MLRRNFIPALSQSIDWRGTAMEIAHAQTKVLRVVGKLVLLGVLVVLLFKVIAAFLALAVVGLLTCVLGRAIYGQRSYFKRILSFTKETLVHSAIVAFRTRTIARAPARWAYWMLLTLAETLQALVVIAGVLIGCVAMIGWVIT